MTTLILLYTRKDCGMVFNIRYGMLNFYIVNDQNRNSFDTNINVLSFYLFKFFEREKISILTQIHIRNPLWCEPCQVIATLRVISHCLVNVRTCYPQTCWSKGGKKYRKLQHQELYRSWWFNKNFKINKELKTKNVCTTFWQKLLT